MRRVRNLLLAVALLAGPSCASEANPNPTFPKRQPLAPPRVLAFYYPWYGTPTGPSARWFHWNPDAPSHASTHTPKLGLYDSKDTAVVRQHVRWAKAAGIDAFVASWWGAGTFEDEAFPVLMHVAEQEGFEVTAFLEDAPTRELLREQVLHLLSRYGGSSAWMRVNGRPVFFLYARVINTLSEEDMVWAFQGTGAFVVGDGASFGKAAAFAGAVFYNPVGDTGGYVYGLPGVASEQHRAGRIMVATVVPGYDDTRIRTPGLAVQREGGALYRAYWGAATQSGADWVVITTFNEWHEGSEIEPSAEFGESYLNLTRELADEWRRAAAKQVRRPRQQDPRPGAPGA